MILVEEKISLGELKKIAKESLDKLVKAVVDVERKIMVIGGELHSDEEEFLLKKGSKQKDLWGINIYPFENKDNFIEFDSMINLRPSFNNFSRGIDNPKIREEIIKIVNNLIQSDLP